MSKYFDSKHNRVVFEGSPATKQYWDDQWQHEDNISELLKTGGGDALVKSLTQRFLKPSSEVKVLDGGCGKGQHVAALNDLGYDAYGIDYAPQTINQIKILRPELNVSVADVRHLPFNDNYFHAYWSLGVIEHFWDGYQETAAEMIRVLKPNGYLFLVFPHLSWLRQTKARLGMYKHLDINSFDQENFYQFALDDKRVRKYFTDRGFVMEYRKLNNGLKGLKDEVAALKPSLQRLYDSKLLPAKVAKVALSIATEPISNHTVVLVLRKAPV